MFNGSLNWSFFDNETLSRHNRFTQLCSVDSAVSKLFQTIVYCLIIFISLTGNFLLVIIVYRNPRMKTTTNLLITNMAVSDLLVPVFIVPAKLFEIHNGRFTWLVGGPLGAMLCKLVPFCADVSTAVSIQSHVVIAVDRFIAVVFHTRRSFLRRTKSCICVMFVTWMIAILFHSPYFYTFRIKTHQKKTLCSMSWEPTFKDTRTTQTGYFLIAFILLFALPLLVITLLYLAIAYSLKRRIDLTNECDNIREKRQKENTTANRMLVSVVMLFTLSYIPRMVFGFVSLYSQSPPVTRCIMEVVRVVVLLMAHSNCAMNPFIFFVFSKSYRKGLRKVRAKLCSFSL